jgi:hypothetical protein
MSGAAESTFRKLTPHNLFVNSLREFLGLPDLYLVRQLRISERGHKMTRARYDRLKRW